MGAMTGVRRILNNAADRALAAGPPSRRDEAVYTVLWLGTSAAAGLLLWVGRRLSR